MRLLSLCRRPRLASGLAWLCLCAALVGCGKDQVAQTGGDNKGENLGKIARYYRQATRTLGHPPANEGEFLAFVKEQAQKEDKQPKESPADWLRSPVDGQPYTIFWGTDMDQEQRTAPSPVVMGYEQQGEGGRRWVLTVMGVKRMSADELRQATFPRGQVPPS